MAMQILAGRLARGINRIAQPEVTQLQFELATGKAILVVTENGDVRSLPISKRVAEVLAANGMSYGS